MSKLFRNIFFVAAAALVSLPAAAQVAQSGNITGYVTDTSGAGVSGATITATSPALMTRRELKTQPDGSFLFDRLPIGTYEIRAEMAGFKALVQPDIVLSAGFTATIGLKLEVGDISQSVTVEGAASVLDVTSVQNTTSFNTSLLENIPSGRDVWSTVAQIPGATSSTFDVGGSRMYQQSSMAIHGSKPGEVVYSFNGLKLNWPGGNGGSTAFYIDHDAQEEFQVVTDAAPAEVSVGGLYTNMITKSGSNSWHGLAAAYYLTDAFQSETKLPTFNGAPVNVGLPFAMARDLTANSGGSIIKDKLWIFAAWRYYVVRQNVLSVRTKAGNPTFDNNHQSDLSGRLDYQINDKHRLSVMYLWNEQNRFYRRSTTYAFVDDSAAQRQIEPAYVLQAQWSALLSPNLTFEARFGYMHLHFPLAYEPVVKPTDISIADTGLSTLTGAATNDYINVTGSTRGAANVSYFKGAFLGGTHNFKAGFDYSHNRKDDIYHINGDIVAYKINNVASRVDAYATPNYARGEFNEWAGFLQDTWTLSRRVTLTLGMRYEGFRAFNPEQTSPPSANFASVFPQRTFPASGNIVSWDTVVPRVGVSWDPMGNSRSVFHFGYSRFMLSEGTRLPEALNANLLSGRSYKWTDTNGDGLPQLDEYFLPANFTSSFGGIATRIDPNLSRPYSDQVNAGYERQVLGDLRVGATFYYRTTRNQISRVNAAAPRSAYSPVTRTNPLTNQPITIYNLDPAFVGKTDYLVTNISQLDDNNYIGVEFNATKRMTKHWQMLSGFTIQKNSGTVGNALSDDFNDPNKDINRGDGRLDQDSTYVVKIAGTVELPYKISLSPKFQFYTGYPLQPTNTFTGLNQNSEAVALGTRGSIRLPNVAYFDLRIARPTRIREKILLEPIADLLNLSNRNPVLAEVTSIGANYLKPSDLLNPFVARFALRLSW
jgi:hypothetical protein